MGPIINAFGSLVTLVAGAWCVSEGGDILGQKYEASIIGGFLLAWLNTAPETIFFIKALDSGNPDVAMGAMSGSIIVVSTCAVGACIWFGGSARPSQTITLLPSVRRQASFLLATLVLTAMIGAFGFNPMLGVLGILEYAVFIYLTLRKGDDYNAKEEDDHSFPDVERGDHSDDEEEEEEESTAKGVAYLVAGALLVFIFAEPFIDAVVVLGNMYHVDAVLLAYFFAPVASEAPEIIESISLSRKGKSQSINVAFSNLTGGTVAKTTLLSGVLCLYGYSRDFAWRSPSYTVAIVLIMICAGAGAYLAWRHATQSKWNGAGLIGLFIAVGIVQWIVNVRVLDPPAAAP